MRLSGRPMLHAVVFAAFLTLIFVGGYFCPGSVMFFVFGYLAQLLVGGIFLMETPKGPIITRYPRLAQLSLVAPFFATLYGGMLFNKIMMIPISLGMGVGMCAVLTMLLANSSWPRKN